MSDSESDEPTPLNINNTALYTFSQGIALYLSQTIFPLIVEKLDEKGCKITVDELMEIISAPNSSNNNLNTSSLAFGGAIPSIAVPRKPVNSNINSNNLNNSNSVNGVNNGNTMCVASQNPLPGKCSYRYKRGDNKGLFCTRPVAPGSAYCTNCVKTRKNLSKDNGVVPGVAPNSVVQGYTASEPQSSQLTVVVYDEKRSLYREPTYNFIVHQQSDGMIAVLGKLSDDGQTIVPLSETEKDIATSLGLKDANE